MKITAPFRHPLATHPAGAVLGYRVDGRPIYAIAGGDGTGEGDGGQGDGGQGDGGQGDGPGTEGKGDGGQGPTGQQPGTEDESTLPAWAQAALKTARAEAGKARVTAKQKAADEARTDLLKQFTALIDPSKADQPATADQLTQQLAAEQAKARDVAVELAAYKAAQTEGARADRLLNSRAFADRLADLDPAGADFGDQLKAAIQAEVDSDPDLYKARPAGAARGGADFTGHQAGVSAAQFAAMGYAERAALFQTDPDTYRRLAG
ncbi:hypothetical protein [Streptomyces halstedii]|uniref:Uncharacterized protein n=1 Tax=Streptomyces halstedii TaxID=1944 RepID=A0A6N9UAX4_STRHA|nr:hypothetical protein [Streptomyces halstedii]NEA19819.1 hypothetical protein [Streptomyces halstedii]